MEYQVSVIVAVYNVEEYIEECLNSLVNQTLIGIEIIVVNDGSTDNSQSIIDRFTKIYTNKIKAYTKQNGGLSDARNYGIGKATGKYIGFVDGDDFVDFNMFELLYEKITNLDADAIICDYYEYYTDSKKQVLRKCTLSNSMGVNILESPHLLCKCSASACNKLFDKQLFNENIFPYGRNYEDSSIIYNILAQSKKIGCCEVPLYYYRLNRGGSLTNVFSKSAFDIFQSCDSIKKYYRENDILQMCCEEIEYICTSNIHNVIVFSKTSLNIRLRWKFVKAAFAYLNFNYPNWRNNKYFINVRNKIGIEFFTSFFYLIQKKYFLYQFVLLAYSMMNFLYQVFNVKGARNGEK